MSKAQKRRQDGCIPVKNEEISTAEKKAKHKRNKLADLGLSPETPMLRKKKGTLYAQISTPIPDSDDSDSSDSDSSDDGNDLPFSKMQQKQLRNIISSSMKDAIGDALKPLTKRVVRIENHMTKLDEMIEKKVDEEYVDSLVEKLDLLDDDV